ncbi:hypothetical protein PRIPAC_96373 [Pristionchus pacificus]|nr:hypothetical protein PRIPAC_96373 [Pristionchus pacificus]
MKCLLPLSALFACVTARQQFVSVKGTLVCEGDIVENARVELWEHDIFTPNDLLTSVSTDILGAFELSGVDNEYMDIKPFLVINHFCNAMPNCPRQTRIDVPVSANKTEVHQLPDINLTNLRDGEDDSCYKRKN